MRVWRRKRNEQMVFLQLTSMVDMFTIILVFLLKSYSTSAVQMNPSQDLDLPTSRTGDEPMEGLKLIVTQEKILVDDENVMLWTEVKKGSKKTRPLLQLYKRLNQEKSKNDTKVVIQVDRRVPYKKLQKVMQTSAMAGFSDFRLVTMDER